MHGLQRDAIAKPSSIAGALPTGAFKSERAPTRKRAAGAKALDLAMIALLSADGENIMVVVAGNAKDLRRLTNSFQYFAPKQVHCAVRLYVETKDAGNRVLTAMETDEDVQRWRVRGKFYRVTAGDMVLACHRTASEIGVAIWTEEEAAARSRAKLFARMDRAIA